MRQDIAIHINSGDCVFASSVIGKQRAFEWIDIPEGQLPNFVYGEITIPIMVSDNQIFLNGVTFACPYTPIYKKIKVRIRKVYSETQIVYLHNPVDGTEWFEVKSSINSTAQRGGIYASEMICVHPGIYHIRIDKGIAMLYAGETSDFKVTNAQRQNTNMMLKCIPGNNYRYPLTGVGLVRYTNSAIATTNLAEVLKREFEADGMSINSATYDEDSKQLHIDFNPTS